MMLGREQGEAKIAVLLYALGQDPMHTVTQRLTTGVTTID